MKDGKKITSILDNYQSDNPGTKKNLLRILQHGNLRDTGKLIIFPVDQGFEHGPDKSFCSNVDAYDPEYHVKLAIEANVNAYAAPLGMLSFAAKYAADIPLILKLNSSCDINNNFGKAKSTTAKSTTVKNTENHHNDDKFSLKTPEPSQYTTSTVMDALKLGCAAVGFTIYPGSDNFKYMIEEAKDIITEAQGYGLPTVIWSYPRFSQICNKDKERCIDVISYATHIAALIGAHIIKVKLPTNNILNPNIEALYKKHHTKIDTLQDMIVHVMKCAFNSKRLVLFSGGETKNIESLYNEIKAISLGGGSGSIIGRNVFQRKRVDAINMLHNIQKIYLSENMTISTPINTNVINNKI